MEHLRVADDVRGRMEADRRANDRLTAAGWPRPRHGGYPVPWLSPRDELSQTDGARLAACASGGICAVCGLGFQADEKALLVINPPGGPNGERFMPGDSITPADEGIITSIDNGVMHPRCARLALAWCPKLRQLMEDDDLVCVEVTAHDAEPEFLDLTGEDRFELRATYREGLVVECPL